jgi:hypothetical protein
MQVLSAYLLETDALAETLVQQRVDVVLAAITQWLRGKGASDPEARSGQFVSLTADGDGRFTREEQRADRGFIEETRLDEFSRGGQTFTTRLTTVAWDRRLYIYSTLSVANSSSVVAPIPTDPRCPSIVRTLLAQATDWKLNGTPIASAQPRDLIGDEGGHQLATEIQQLGRSLPIIAVSEIEGETLWPRLAEELAYDLTLHGKVLPRPTRPRKDWSDCLAKTTGRASSTAALVQAAECGRFAGNRCASEAVPLGRGQA